MNQSSEDKYKKLYTLVNNLMAKVGCDGEIEINAESEIVCNMMDALFDIDGGLSDNDLYGFTEKVKTKYIGDI